MIYIPAQESPGGTAIEDDATIKKILMHHDLWLPQTHDPPQEELGRINLHVQPHRCYEWWKAINHVPGNEYSDGTFAQSPYEDEYSQLETCEY